jgi:hypothetical protein
MKTSIDIDEVLWRKFRVACLERGEPAGRVMETLIRALLDKWAKEKVK